MESTMRQDESAHLDLRKALVVRIERVELAERPSHAFHSIRDDLLTSLVDEMRSGRRRTGDVGRTDVFENDRFDQAEIERLLIDRWRSVSLTRWRVQVVFMDCGAHECQLRHGRRRGSVYRETRLRRERGVHSSFGYEVSELVRPPLVLAVANVCPERQSRGVVPVRVGRERVDLALRDTGRRQ